MQNLDKPRVSVIMNCYNGEKYLHESLKSLFDQDYKNWELIFLDNNSKDQSLQIISRIKDDRIKIYHLNSKLNLYQARNLAISKTSGHYVSFLDTDDIWENNKLSYQVFLAKKKNYKILYSNYFIKDQIKKKIYLKFKKNLINSGTTKQLLKNYTIGIVTVLLERNIFKDFLFNDKYNIIGDFDLFVRLSEKYKIFYSHEPLATYRIHESNYSKKIEIYINELESWLKDNEGEFNSYFSLIWQKYYLLKLKLKMFFSSYRGV